MPELIIKIDPDRDYFHDSVRKLLSDIDAAIKAKGADPSAHDTIDCTYGDELAWISGSITIRLDKAGTSLPNIDQEFQDLVDAYDAALVSPPAPPVPE